MKNFAKTKILATIGPASDSEAQLSKMINAGVDAVRMNFSHGSFEYFETVFERIHNVCVECNHPLPVLVDLQGPKIRVGELENGEIYLSTGDNIEITTEIFIGNKNKISATYERLVKDSEIGNSIVIDDGLIRLEVSEKKTKSIICKIIEGGVLRPKKGINLPGMKLSVSAVTKKDKENLEFALKHRVDFIALSFVRSAADILELQDWLKNNGHNKYIIAKIEKPEAVENFDEIIKHADGIMIARGDLGVEMEPQDVPIIQKNIIRKCRAEGKLVITATQMLESMITNPVPTRAEATDIANAVWDGTDVVMLSGETSIGKYPVESVKVMNDIIVRSESQPHLNTKIEYNIPEDLESNLFDSTGMAIAELAKRVKADYVILFTHLGRKAKAVIKYRPPVPVIVFSDNFDTLNILNLHYGTYPLFEEGFDIEETAVEKAIEILKEKSIVENGNILLFNSGAPYKDKNRRNWTRFVVVE